MKKTKRDYIARLVIYDLPTMSAKDLIRLHRWLDDFAIDKIDPKEYSKLFTAKLMK